MTKKIRATFSESLSAVLPILIIVIILSLTVAPMDTSVTVCFIFGAVFLIIGMMFFTLGAEMSMSKIGESVGSCMTRSKKIRLIILLSFILGAIITVSEPDLSVLAGQISAIPSSALIYSVALGVGLFLVVAVLRMIFGVSLNIILIASYIIVFVLAFFVPNSFLAVAFDSGGVTTGPMTVPFIMAFGIGVSSIRSDENASNDSFGLVSLCSVGPIIAVMTLGMIYKPDSSDISESVLPGVDNSVQLGRLFASEIPSYMLEMAKSLLPIVIFFAIFQIAFIRLNKTSLVKILVGLVYTYVGLVIFLTGANVGFMPAGKELGRLLASSGSSWVIIPIAALMGYFVVKAEPAVYVLNKQVEEMTDGAISAKLMGTSLSVGVAASLGLAMVRVMTGISILWFVIPGYSIAIITSFFVPKLYTAIAFDSGGVASGPMTAAFLLPFAQGACTALGGDLAADAFGVVAMVAMTPLITIQLLGIISKFRKPAKTAVPAVAAFTKEDLYTIIDL